MLSSDLRWLFLQEIYAQSLIVVSIDILLSCFSLLDILVEKSLAAPKLEISVETSSTIPSFNVAMETMAYLYMINIYTNDDLPIKKW